MPSDCGPLREQIGENEPVTAVENHPIAAERGVGRHDRGKFLFSFTVSAAAEVRIEASKHDARKFESLSLGDFSCVGCIFCIR